MPLQSILDKGENLINLRRAYIQDRMSTTDISNNSKSLFGQQIGAAAVYNALIRNKIDVRSKSESVSMATSTLDINKSFLNERTIEWVDGFLLGDGGIGFKHNESYRGSRFGIGSSQQEWAEYAMSGLNEYSPTTPKVSGRIREKAPNPIWSSKTLTHPDIVYQAKRWYPINNNYVKKVPSDVRITPLSVLLWYLGDGSITKYGVSYVVRIATCSFDISDIDNILIPKLKGFGIDAIRTDGKNDIKIPTSSLNDFFKLIGNKSPIGCYNYKFEYAPWLNLYRISDIALNEKEKWRIQYLYKVGKLDCLKSPGDKIILFNEEQKKNIREILDNHANHKEYLKVEDKKDSNLTKIGKIIKNDVERWNARYMITRGIVDCEKDSMLTDEQKMVLREKLDLYGDKSAIPKHLIDYEFLKYRQEGFPYYDFSIDELNSKMDSLAGFNPVEEEGLFKWDGYGTELANYFHPHMFECNKKGKISAIDFFNSDEDFKRGISKLIALYPKITKAKIREICCNEMASSRINNFPPRVMMTILKKLYSDKKIIMLDPCAGFSGRMLGCYASDIVKKYIGIDLSTKTYNGLVKTKKWISTLKSRKDFEIELINANCIEAITDIRGEIDFIFTSPPFLDEEQYSGVQVETSYNKWREIFIRPFIEKSYEVLRTGGKLSVYTEAIRRNDFPVDFCNISKEVGFNRLEDIRFRVPCRENLRSNSKFRIVSAMVFEKDK